MFHKSKCVANVVQMGQLRTIVALKGPGLKLFPETVLSGYGPLVNGVHVVRFFRPGLLLPGEWSERACIKSHKIVNKKNCGFKVR